MLAFAVIVALPTATAVTLPLETVATLVFDDDQVIVLFVAFSGAIVAVKVNDSPVVIVIEVLLRVIDVTSIGLTITEHSACTFPIFALIVALPAETAVILPLETVATLVFDEDHVIVLFVAFSGVMVAVKLTDSPDERVTDVWLSVMEVALISVGSKSDSSEQAQHITINNKIVIICDVN